MRNFLNANIKQLSEDEKYTCKAILSKFECEETLLNMNNEKSLGSDDLTVEFDKTICNDLKQYCIQFIKYSFMQGFLNTPTKTRTFILSSKIREIIRDIW